MSVVVSLLYLQPWLCPAKPCMRVLQNLMPSGNRQGVGPSGAAGPGATGAGTPQDFPVPDISDKTYRVIPAPQGQAPLLRVIYSPADCFSDKTVFRFLTHAKLLFSSGLCARCAHRPASPPWTLSSRQRDTPCHPCSPFRALRTPGFVGGPFICPPPWAQQVHRERDVLAACVKH